MWNYLNTIGRTNACHLQNITVTLPFKTCLFSTKYNKNIHFVEIANIIRKGEWLKKKHANKKA